MVKTEWLLSRFSRQAKNDDNFQSCIEQIEEVLSIYQKSHIVLVAGDLNASLSEHRGNAQDVYCSEPQ